MSYIYLPQYPISHVDSVSVDADRVFGAGTQISTSDIFFYPSGKVVSEGGYFSKGRRNIKIDYIAGYAPVVNNTFNSAVSTYPIPLDLKQTMIEMCVECFKEGITGVHTVVNQEGQTSFIKLLQNNSFWSNVLNKYKAFDMQFQYRDE